MYRFNKPQNTLLSKKDLIEGEPIEDKVTRMLINKEPIKDGAPLLYTERKDGVMAGYNVRTDRWEIAAEAMDKIAASKQAKKDEIAKIESDKKEAKVIEMKLDGGAESTHGEAESK